MRKRETDPYCATLLAVLAVAAFLLLWIIFHP